MQLLLCFARLFLYFLLQREEKVEKAFKVNVTSEAFCGSLQNGGFVLLRFLMTPFSLYCCETSLG